ncbi:MAG: translation initiation factor IF-2 [Candidatus Woesearchaeota archaeon]|jgi:translation initiation factor 5B|nr:translation initiation factor IF-2 [Candidatus Woesearchaeota archaeon]
MAYLRQPIISILGHVDHGKTSLLDYIRNSKMIAKEAGGITQHIGATEVPKEDVLKIVKGVLPKEAVKIPGLLFIDTPGHKAFTSLRKRGGSISDIGILIVDINEGFMPQTIEAIEILKSMKTPFIVAANKLDNIPGFQSDSKKKLIENIESQRQEVIYRVEEKVYEIVGKISEYGYECDRFDRVDDFTKKIAIVPISAKSGEGVTELLTTLVGLTQKYMEKKLTIENEEMSKGVILEVKDYVGLGKTIDVILYDGVAKVDDIVLVLDIDCVQRSRLKSILKPGELKEIRDSSTKFKAVKEVHAAAGIKFACPEFNDIKAGMPIITLRKNAKAEIVEKYILELEAEQAEITISSEDEGVLVKADTLGSLEALSNILAEHEIPIRKAQIGKISKKDIIDVGSDVERSPKNALLLNFSQKIDDELHIMAKEYKVDIISNDIIYKLVEDSVEWMKKKEKEINRLKLENLIMPFKIKILNNCIFRTSSPAIVGIEVMGGTLKSGVTLVTDYGKKVGKIKGIKDKEENLKSLAFGKSAAVSMDDLVIGRHAQEDSVLYSFMGEGNFRNLKKSADLLSSDEKSAMRELAEVMRKENSLWGM